MLSSTYHHNAWLKYFMYQQDGIEGLEELKELAGQKS